MTSFTGYRIIVSTNAADRTFTIVDQAGSIVFDVNNEPHVYRDWTSARTEFDELERVAREDEGERMG